MKLTKPNPATVRAVGARLSRLKNLLPLASLIAGFTLISVGIGEIFGSGAGLIAAGVALVVLGAPIVRT